MGSYVGLLTASEIRQLIVNEDLISGYIDMETQMQPAGFDVTLAKVLTIDKMEPHELSEAKHVFLFHMIPVLNLVEPLETLRPYCLITNEFFNMPDNVTANCITKSSLTRLGAVLGSGIIDAGYSGRLSFSLISTLPIIMHPGDGIAQVQFIKHKRTFKYHGKYAEKKQV
jgi:dUTP pyrophosphatase